MAAMAGRCWMVVRSQKCSRLDLLASSLSAFDPQETLEVPPAPTAAAATECHK
jgi:hypothetical protein